MSSLFSGKAIMRRRPFAKGISMLSAALTVLPSADIPAPANQAAPPDSRRRRKGLNVSLWDMVMKASGALKRPSGLDESQFIAPTSNHIKAGDVLPTMK